MSNTRKSNMGKRRKLQDLYARGTEVKFSGPDEVESEDTIVVWVTPPSPLQREQALREAQAERARLILKARRDPESQPGLVTEELIERMSLEEVCEYIVTMSDGEQQTEATRNVLRRDEWEDIDALRDSMRRWEEAGAPTDDPEWEELLERDRIFGEDVAEEVSRIQEAEVESLKLLPRVELNKRAFEKRLDSLGNQQFMDTYQTYLMFYSCRDGDDHQELFFEDVSDMRSMPDEVQEALLREFSKFISEVGEAKNSPRVADGSEQSAPPEEPETSESSTPEA